MARTLYQAPDAQSLEQSLDIKQTDGIELERLESEIPAEEYGFKVLEMSPGFAAVQRRRELSPYMGDITFNKQTVRRVT